MAQAVSTIVISVCASASGPVNIALFPLMDINLAKGLHNIVNSILYTVMQLPSLTAQRCVNHGVSNPKFPTSAGSGGAGLLMCLPDMNPPVNMLVAGLRNLGVMIDNWLDVSSIIAQRSLGITAGRQDLDCKSTAKSLTPAYYSKELFDGKAGDYDTQLKIANRAKIVVGLTDGLYAVTDGVHAQYFNHYDSVDSQTSPYAWPIEIDTRFGVAAVTFRAGSGAEERDGTGETTTTMMGCRSEMLIGMKPVTVPRS